MRERLREAVEVFAETERQRGHFFDPPPAEGHPTHTLSLTFLLPTGSVWVCSDGRRWGSQCYSEGSSTVGSSPPLPRLTLPGVTLPAVAPFCFLLLSAHWIDEFFLFYLAVSHLLELMPLSSPAVSPSSRGTSPTYHQPHCSARLTDLCFECVVLMFSCSMVR